jgi:hypothetical protein
MRQLLAALACVVLLCSCGCPPAEKTTTDPGSVNKTPPPTGGPKNVKAEGVSPKGD